MYILPLKYALKDAGLRASDGVENMGRPLPEPKKLLLLRLELSLRWKSFFCEHNGLKPEIAYNLLIMKIEIRAKFQLTKIECTFGKCLLENTLS